MKLRPLAAGLVFLLLAGCGQAGDKVALEAADAAASADAAGPTMDLMKPPPPGAPEASASPGVAVPAGLPMLAYSYEYGIEAPAKRVRDLAAGHEAACAAAGPLKCQMTRSSVSQAGEDRVSAHLELRATPAWLTGFRAGLAGDAEAAGGRVTRSDVESEDLSRQIIDTDARLRAMTTLRDRLQALLASRPGKLSDLVEIERELARVQGDIDSAQSQLAEMRGRVSMSAVTINYNAFGVAAPQGVLSPLGRALTDFLGIVVFTLAAMVRLIAWLLPWALVGGLLWWLLRHRLAKIFRRRSDAPKEG